MSESYTGGKRKYICQRVIHVIRKIYMSESYTSDMRKYMCQRVIQVIRENIRGRELYK